MVDGAALEKRWAAMPRGFESHPLRQMVKAKFGAPADFKRKIEFLVFVPRSGTPEAGFPHF